MDFDEPLRCSFCEKTQSEVQLIIEKPDVAICDSCVVNYSSGADDAALPVERPGACTFCSKCLGFLFLETTAQFLAAQNTGSVGVA